jgi:adenosylcobinamide-GDP ribazoletransferase
MRRYIIALQFLTIIPLPWTIHTDAKSLGRSTALFPVAGLTIGALLAGLNWLISPLLERSLCDAILIAALTVLTGGLHLDGLADVCDGLAARGDRQRFLAVMKDSQVGAIGASGLVLDILLKWQALTAVPVGLKMQTLLIFPVLARFGQVLTITGARNARQDGLGAVFIHGTGYGSLFLAFITAASCAVWLTGMKGIASLAAVCLLSGAGRLFFNHRLGGLTGDTVGCISELNEITALIIFSAVM